MHSGKRNRLLSCIYRSIDRTGFKTLRCHAYFTPLENLYTYVLKLKFLTGCIKNEPILVGVSFPVTTTSCFLQS